MTDTEYQRTKIVELSEQGYGIREISRELNVSRNTVRRWIRRYAEEYSLEDGRRHNSGLRRMTKEKRTEMQLHYEIHPFTPTRYFATRYDVCIQTIRNNLQSTGLNYRHAKRATLTEAHKLARLNFARDYLDFDWTNVIFSGQETFTSSQYGGLTLWRQDTSDDQETSEALRKRITANMWAWMGTGGVGELVHIPSRAKAPSYIELLGDTMLPTVRTVYPQEEVPTFFYMHEHSRVHSTRVVSDWFHQHPEITLIPWPPKSPDLNPIENLWGLMVKLWDNQNVRSRLSIVAHCNEIWDYMRGTDICSRLVETIRSRLLNVIEKNGDYIQF